VVNQLKKLRRPFLTPCRLTKGIKQALAEHIQGRRPMISRYVMREGGGGGDESSFRLLMFPKARVRREERARPAQEVG